MCIRSEDANARPRSDAKKQNKNRDVILKLLAFTFAMIVVPIGSYFVTVNRVFNGKLSTYLPTHRTLFCLKKKKQ